MVDQALLVFMTNEEDKIEKIGTGELNRWHWTYAHGNFESDYGFDMVIFNEPEPTHDGYFLATASNNKSVLVNMVYDEEISRFVGRCCYIDDYEALKHINSPQDWA